MTLSEYLDRNAITHDAFAITIGVSRPTVSRYVNGQRFPREDELRRIAEVTGGLVTANDFMTSVRSASTPSRDDGSSDPDDDATEEGDAVTALPLRAGRAARRRPSAPPFDFRRAG